MKLRNHIFALLLSFALLLGLGVPALAAEADGDTESPRPVILAVSAGTDYKTSLKVDVGGVENALAKAFPEYDVLRAFTSPEVIDTLAERDSLEVEDVTSALDRLAAGGAEDVTLLPVGLTEEEIRLSLAETAEKYAGTFAALRVGRALLDREDGAAELVSALTPALQRWERKDTAIVLAAPWQLTAAP